MKTNLPQSALNSSKLSSGSNNSSSFLSQNFGPSNRDITSFDSSISNSNSQSHAISNNSSQITKQYQVMFADFDKTDRPRESNSPTPKSKKNALLSNSVLFGSYADLNSSKRMSYCGANEGMSSIISTSVTSSPSFSKSTRFGGQNIKNNVNRLITKNKFRAQLKSTNSSISNPVFANFVELTGEEFSDYEDLQSELNSVHFQNDTLLRAGSRSSISTFKPTPRDSSQPSNSENSAGCYENCTVLSPKETASTNMETTRIQNYQKPKFNVLKRIDKPHHNPQRNSIAGPSSTCLKNSLNINAKLTKELDLNFKPSLLSPQLLTFTNTNLISELSVKNYAKNNEEMHGVLRRKNSLEPKPPHRRNSKLSTEKIVKRGDFGLVIQFEGLKQLSSYGLTYASQLLSIIVRSSKTNSVLRTGLLHADLSTGSKMVQDFFLAVTGDTIRNLVIKINSKKSSEKLSQNHKGKASSAPSLAIVSSSGISPALTTTEISIPDSSSQETERDRTTSNSGKPLSKHRASTDSTDSGVGSQLDHSEERIIGSPTSVNSSSSSQPSPDSHYQNREFIQLVKFETQKQSSTSHEQNMASTDFSSTSNEQSLNTCENTSSAESSPQKSAETKTNPELKKEPNSKSNNDESSAGSIDLLNSDLDFEFTLFHVGFDVLPCFTVLRGLNVDIHHFSMKSGKTAYLKIFTETGASETGLLPSFFLPKSTYV